MALSAAITWRCRTGGTTTGGGGFKVGASGTDYSQQDAAQYSPSTTLTSSGAGAVALYASAAADMVGNIINITAGTNFTTGRYEITSVSVGVSITVDRNCTTGAGSAGSGFIGGALSGPVLAATLTVAGNTIDLAAGTFSTTAVVIMNAGTAAGGKIKLTSSAGATISAGNATNYATVRTAGYNEISGLTLTTTNTWTGARCVDMSTAGGPCAVLNCTLTGNGKNAPGVYLGDNAFIVSGCRITACNAGVLSTGASRMYGTVYGCAISANTIGIQIDAGTSLSHIAVVSNLIYSNTGDGMVVSASVLNNLTVIGNVFHGNTGDGLQLYTTTTDRLQSVINNVFTSNGAYGIQGSASTIDNTTQNNTTNAFYNNTSGLRQHLSAGDGDITLTGDPFTNAAGGDFSLNSTAGAGAALKSMGYPTTMVAAATTTNINVGVAQNSSVAAGGGLIRNPGLDGGLI